MRNAARKFHDFDAPLNIAAGVRNCLSMLGRKQFGQAVELLVNQLEKLEHDACATLWIGRCPAGLCCLSVGDGVFDLGVLGQRDPGLDFAGIGIEDVAETTGCPINDLATNEMADFTHGTHSSAFFKRLRIAGFEHLARFCRDFCSFSIAGHSKFASSLRRMSQRDLVDELAGLAEGCAENIPSGNVFMVECKADTDPLFPADP